MDRATSLSRRILLFLLLLAGAPGGHAWPASRSVFGYPGTPQKDMAIFPQWLSVMARHPKEDRPHAACDGRHPSDCHLRKWLAFLNGIRNQPARRQLDEVNQFANREKYVLDLVNYGLEDYWAVVREFMDNGGDCEDYAIAKLYSLRYLGFSADSLRIVVVMDTNLGVGHAVLAVDLDGQTLILDNQADEVLADHAIVHYVPVFSINETGWWIHQPPS